MKSDDDKFFGFVGIAPWRIVPEEPRHNTIHQAIYQSAALEGIPVKYFGLNSSLETSWIHQFLPFSVLKRFPVMRYRYMKNVALEIKKMHTKNSLIYIYEGSFSWLILLKLLSSQTDSGSVLCNLFPASKYEKLMFKGSKMKIRFRAMFWGFSRIKHVIITVDTCRLAGLINHYLRDSSKVEVFPLPSSFGLRENKSTTQKDHYRVLVNVRNFPKGDIDKLLEDSCKSCIFVFPRGPMADRNFSLDLGRHENAFFEDKNIEINAYQGYVDSFDYMIFLYEPSLDTSGKILDAITRQIPVCLPAQAEQWVELSREWNATHIYEFGNLESIKQSFIHPSFTSATSLDPPPFIPIYSLKTMKKYVYLKDTFRQHSSVKSVLVLRIVIDAHYWFFLFLGKTYTAFINIGNFRRKFSSA